MSERVIVSQEVLDGLEAVRRSGASNMLDRPVVTLLAEQMGFTETAEWIRANPAEYARGVFRGFEANDE